MPLEYVLVMGDLIESRQIAVFLRQLLGVQR